MVIIITGSDSSVAFQQLFLKTDFTFPQISTPTTTATTTIDNTGKYISQIII